MIVSSCQDKCEFANNRHADLQIVHNQKSLPNIDLDRLMVFDHTNKAR